MPERDPGGERVRRTFRLSGGTGGRARDEVREELEHHLELCTQELMNQGWSAVDARAEARRRFGDVEFTTEYCARETARVYADGRRTMWLDDLTQDLKYATRTLFRTPTYTLVVVLTLAAGIAANTTIFSLMNPYLFRPLPFPAADELVQLGGYNPLDGWDGGRFSAPEIADLQERSRAVDEIGFYYYGTANLTGGDRAERHNVGRMSGNMFRILGTPPLLGRYLASGDAGPGGTEVVVMGETLWMDRYGGDPDIVGSAIELDGRPHTVVGVMPRDFTFPFGGLHLWTPARDDAVQTDRARSVALPVARLNAGWDRDRAAAELTAVQAELGILHPDVDGRYSRVSVKPLREALNFAWDILRIAFYLLLGAVVFVLVIACVNVASLTLARASARAREVAVRSAVGADRGRLVRQLLTESFLLAVVGGSLGILLAHLATGALNGLIPEDLYRIGDVTVDGRVLAYSTLITLATPLVFGMAPALRVARSPLGATLRTGGAAGTGREALWGRRALVVVEVALAIVLVTGTGLMIRSLRAVSAVELGFDAERLVSATVRPGDLDYPGTDELAAYFTEAKARLAAHPGVQAVGSASHMPLNNETILIRYQRPDAGGAPFEEWPSALTSLADGGYFEAMGIPVLEGRAFTATDATEGSPVIVSRTLADRLFPAGDAVGQTLQWGRDEGSTSATIVGVVGEVRFADLTSVERPHLYRPLDGTATRRRFLVIRTGGDPSALIAPARETLRDLDADLPAGVQQVTSIVDQKTLLWSMSSTFLGIFGLVALLLAALGIYGLMSFSVAQRHREMGLRMALGADGAEIRRKVVGGGVKLTAVGIVAGVGLAIPAAGAVRSVLFGVSALDPVTLVAVVSVFGLVAVVAAAVPAWRASRVDPLQVLRSE